MKKKRIRFKKSFWILIFTIIVCIVGLICYSKYKKHINSPEYLLEEKGYTVEQVSSIIKNNKLTKMLLDREYNPYILDIMDSKYYIEKNLDTYLEYKEKYPNMEYNEIISIINVKANTDWYSKVTDSDLTKNNLVLVNKFHSLSSEYVIEDLTEMSVTYAYSGKMLRTEAYAAFKSLSNAAKKAGLTIIATNTYRSYTAQEKTYNAIKSSNGREYADSYAARPGHSEHQTGLAVDVGTLKSDVNFVDTEEFTWMQEHAHEYGFILRYPEGKENITGFSYEPWHYRYVGIEVAKEIKKAGITFDEYYAYYVE